MQLTVLINYCDRRRLCLTCVIVLLIRRKRCAIGVCDKLRVVVNRHCHIIINYFTIIIIKVFYYNRIICLPHRLFRLQVKHHHHHLKVPVAVPVPIKPPSGYHSDYYPGPTLDHPPPSGPYDSPEVYLHHIINIMT